MKLTDCIFFLATRLSKELKKYFDKQLQSIGITAGGWSVLMAIFENGEMLQKDISNILCIENPTVTKIIDNLEKKGLIKRTAHKSDRRAFVIKLTKKGEKFKNDVLASGKCFMSWVTSELTEEELNNLKKLLNKLYYSILERENKPVC